MQTVHFTECLVSLLKNLQSKTRQYKKGLLLVCDSVQCVKLVSPFGKDLSPAFTCHIVLQLPEDRESHPRIQQAGIPSTISYVTSVCPSVCLSVRPSACPSVCPSVRMSIRPPVCPSVCLSVCPSVRPPVCPSVRPPVCPSFCLSERTEQLNSHRTTQLPQNGIL